MDEEEEEAPLNDDDGDEEQHSEGRVNELNWMQQPNYVINTFPVC